jgi:hypothetical protein
MGRIAPTNRLTAHVHQVFCRHFSVALHIVSRVESFGSLDDLLSCAAPAHGFECAELSHTYTGRRASVQQETNRRPGRSLVARGILDWQRTMLFMHIPGREHT